MAPSSCSRKGSQVGFCLMLSCLEKRVAPIVLHISQIPPFFFFPNAEKSPPIWSLHTGVVPHMQLSTSLPLKLFHFYCPCPCPPTFFSLQNCTHYSRYGWNMEFQNGIMIFLILCSCPNNPEHVICLFWLLPGANLAFCGSVINWRTQLSGNSELHQAMALYVKLGWIFLLRVLLFFL